jgi:hypothetical protein
MRWLIALTLILAGCGPPPVHYRNTQNNSFGQAEFNSDRDDCERNSGRPASEVAGAPSGAVTVIDQRLLASCLAGRGWQAIPGK